MGFVDLLEAWLGSGQWALVGGAAGSVMVWEDRVANAIKQTTE